MSPNLILLLAGLIFQKPTLVPCMEVDPAGEVEPVEIQESVVNIEMTC